MSSSTSKTSLRRSRSFSSIPQLHRLSRLPVRNSIQKGRGDSLTRPDKLSLDRNLTRASSNLSNLSRLGRQRSGSLVRQTLNTPLSTCRSARKSPLVSSMRKDTRPIVDKRWQYEQTVKVRTFVAKHIPHIDQNGIKSGIALELFVGLMDSYFKLIDKRIFITRENYVEEVPLNLKRYRYVTPVKPSLMKTVNTPHSWPHVIAILSWLTDTISQIHDSMTPTSEMVNIVDDYVMELYTQWVNFQDDSGEPKFSYDGLADQLESMMKVDDEEMNKLEMELENLRAETLAYSQKRSIKEEKIGSLQANIKSVNEKCDVYMTENETFEKQITEQHAKYVTKIKKIDQELSVLHKTEEDAKAVITSQPYSFLEKQQLTQEIKDFQNTLKLREDRCKQQRELVSSYDFQLSDIKQQMEANAYQYNNIVNQLELVSSEFKDLRIRENGFARRDTEPEMQEALALLKEAIGKLKLKLEQSDKKMEELAKRTKEIEAELVIVKKEEDDISKLEAELNITHAHRMKKVKLEQEKILAEVNKYENAFIKLKNAKCDITPLQEQLKELEKQKEEHIVFKEDLMARALEFFLKLEVRMSNNLQTYMNVMEEITAAMVASQEQAITGSQNRIEKLKATRTEVECNEEKYTN